MLLNWVVPWNEPEARDRSRRRDPLADPLDGPEWDGLRWLLPLIVWFGARDSARAPDRAARRVRRPLRSSGAAHGAGIPH
ncbi:hypothetical protein GGE12_001467 [Rhizobium mongolense]|uniref:Uncharacterized protein n=1 Tax=Rhizobium mongolense TaxID=57676 RepID=A0A7W6WCU3_9HYPH|nr:hypothetical protein [Rhizobium mongolense]